MEFDHPSEKGKENEKARQERNYGDITIDFSAFVLSLSSTALVAIGEIPDPVTKETKRNLTVAKQMIDVINMLREKTKGNLTKHEDELVAGLCTELKMKYVQAINFK